MINENNDRNRSSSVKTSAEIDELLVEPSQKALFAFWMEMREENLIPLATKIDPSRIPQLLKNITIFDVLSKTEVIYRLVGTAVAERMGHDPTGKNVISLSSDENRALMAKLLYAIVQQPAGLLIEYENVYETGRRSIVNTLNLPLQPAVGATPRILSTHLRRETIAYEDKKSATSVAETISKFVWIDIGAGTPEIFQADG